MPPAKRKAVELAARLFLTAARDPRDFAAWWEKNEKHAQVLLEALAWPEKTEGGANGVQEKITVGPFVMHNTLHLEEEKLASTIAVVEKATARIRSSDSKFAKVLYGDVFVVGKISQSREMAWYYIDDSLYLRLMKGLTEVRSLCHELGHRYWYKFLQGDAPRQWRTTYYLMKNTNAPKVVLPKVGEPLGVPVSGHKEMPIVESYGVSSRGTRVIKLVGGGEVAVSGLFGLLEQQAVALKFPTPYAATSAEEFFAECFADYVGGTLAPEHVKLLEETVGIA